MFALGSILSIAGIGKFFASNWKIILGALAALALAFFVYSYDARGRQIALQKAEIARLEGDLKASETKAKLQEKIAEITAKRLQEREEEARKFGRVIEGARNAPESKNGTVAPVLDDVLDSIDGMRRSDKPVR